MEGHALAKSRIVTRGWNSKIDKCDQLRAEINETNIYTYIPIAVPSAVAIVTTTEVCRVPFLIAAHTSMDPPSSPTVYTVCSNPMVTSGRESICIL